MPRGLTLIELMIALAVVALLAAVALPTFIDSIRKGRRAEAVSALNAVLIAQERFRANSAGYAGLLTEPVTATPPGLGLPGTTPNGHYTIALSDVGVDSYVVTATAASDSSQARDGGCVRLRVRVNQGNPFYGSAGTSGPFVEGASNPCWSQ